MLQGKCALITGSTRGLGRAIASRLAADGCNIVLNGFAEAQDVEDALSELERMGIGAAHHGADLAVPGQITDLMRFAVEKFGAVDVLVNNAVVRHSSPIETLPVEQWDESLAVNLSAAFHTIRLALPAMRRRGWGRIVNVASIYSFIAAPGRADYITTKTALLGLTRAVALETAGSEITCNAVCPGTLPTPPIQARIERLAAERGVSMERATEEYLANRQPGNRFVSVEAVAALVAFLCGPLARDITGAAMPVDGGWSAS